RGVEVKEEEVKDDDLEWVRWWQDGEIPLKINELMINPIGDDRDEWIELANNTDREIDLKGWYLCDSKCALDAMEGGYRIGEMKMPGRGFGVIRKSESGINLNNDTDKIFLYDPNHNWVDAMEYDYNGQEGGSLSWSGTQWLDTDFSSPGSKNIFENEEKNQMQANDEELWQDKGLEDGLVGSLEQIRGMTDGDKVWVKGLVLVDYGLINQDSLWIGDETAGLMLKGEVLQGFKKGEGILVSGEVDSLKYQKIIRVEEAKIVDTDQLQLNKIAISEIDKFQDRLVKVAGKIKQKTTSESFVLNDGVGEVKVLIKDGIGVDKEIVKIGNWLEVSGIVVMTVDGYKLYPTEKNDIVLVGGGVLPQVGPDWPCLVSLWW
ncbi:MAG: lamin tail domain-containing protein, partial [Patescibacteria group bacterium]